LTESKKEKKHKNNNDVKNQVEWFSPKSMNMKWNPINITTDLTFQALIPKGIFWFGSQLEVRGKIMPSAAKDGANARKKASVKKFQMDETCVSNAQFRDFVESTQYITDAEIFGYCHILSTF